jgi:glycosyltransferase involved in cell wall biosynthesis
MQRPVISVIIPAFNEEKAIGVVLSETFSAMENLKMTYEIIVVDDGSTDNTARVVSNYKATVVSCEQNRGKGYAVRKGIQKAKGRIIVTIDADGAYRPEEISNLITPLFNGADIVAGSRFLGSVGDSTTRINRVGNFLLNATITSLTGTRITDSQTGFRALKREVVDKMHLTSTGFEIESEITVKGLQNDFKFQEKPVTCKRRLYNISRVKILRDGLRMFRTIIESNFTIHQSASTPLHVRRIVSLTWESLMKTLDRIVRGGIPVRIRSAIWRLLGIPLRS